MNWTLNGTLVEDEQREIVFILPENATEEVKKTIQKAPDMKSAIEGFVKEVNGGKLKQRKTYNSFVELLKAMQ